jgi:hypothetical protein
MKAFCWLLLICFIVTVTAGFAGADAPDNTTGYLQVSSTPSGAEIYLDLVFKGITPEPKGFINITNLTPHEYRLVLKKASYLDYISTVKIVSGQTVTVSANLQAANLTSQENPGNTIITGALVVIIVIILAGFVVLYARDRRKPEEPEKIELD